MDKGGLSSGDGVLREEGNLGADAQRGEGHVKRGPRTEVAMPTGRQTQEGCRYKPRNARARWHPPEAGRGKEGSSRGGFRGSWALLTRERGLLAARTERECISDLKPPRLWHFCYSGHGKWISRLTGWDTGFSKCRNPAPAASHPVSEKSRRRVTICLLFPPAAWGSSAPKSVGPGPTTLRVESQHREQVIYTRTWQLLCTDGETETHRGRVLAQGHRGVRSRASVSGLLHPYFTCFEI